MNIIEKDIEYVLNTYARFPVALVRGKGSTVYDVNGKSYIDMTSGIGVNAFGFCDDEWQKAITLQASQLQHTSNLFYTEPCVLLAEELCKKAQMSKVFFSNSGAEANECAIKAARRYSLMKHGDGYYNIITFKNSFHGRTITTLSATGQEHYHTDFSPFTEGFLYADTDNTDSLFSLAENNKCAAIMLETIQGEGGVYELPDSIIDSVKEISEKFDIPVIIDEVQTGNGRTGKYFSYMHHCLTPDIVTTAKGLGGGLPIGATLFSEKMKDALTQGTHGSTFGGNPIACRGALSIVKRIDDKLLSDILEKGEYIKSELLKLGNVRSVSGKGLMLGIDISGDVKDAIARCIENGVLVLSAKSKLRLLPPLNITQCELKKAIDIIKLSL